MINIAALTHHKNTPSSRFRVRNHIPALKKLGFNIVDLQRNWSSENSGLMFPNKRIKNSFIKASLAFGYELLNINQTFSRVLTSRSYDAVLISRELINGYPSFENFIKKPIIYDIDDAVFLNKYSEIGIVKILKRSDVVIAGNEFLADYCSKYSKNVHIIPTGVDTDKFIPKIKRNDKFILGWSGTSSSFDFFLPIEDALVSFFEKNNNAILKICSDRFPSELKKLQKYIHFQIWTNDNEVSEIQSFDVGIMPLVDSPWTRGKCAYKCLLYASCGIPFVCSPVGMNNDLINLGRVGLLASSDDEWVDVLNFMYNNRSTLAEIFPDGRDVIIKNFSNDIIIKNISMILNTVSSSNKK
jgi:glycosyltransferase involved in cell wall biosynthesis